MYPLKISVDLMRLNGARVLAAKDVNGRTCYYVAVPVQNCYIPRERTSAHLMLNAIPTPNSPYGDFLLKPYIKSEDYHLLSDQEKQALPILGKATFLKGDVTKDAAAMAAQAGQVVTETVDLSTAMNDAGNAFMNPTPDDALPFDTPV